MRPLTFRALAVLTLLAGFAAVPAYSGTRAACRFTGPGDNPNAAPGVVLSIQGNQARLDIQVYPWNASLLYDRSSGVLTVLDHVMHTYDEYGSAKRMMVRGALGMALRVNDMRLKNGGNPADVKLRDQLAASIQTVFGGTFHKTASGRKVGNWTADLYEEKNGAVLLSAGALASSKAMSSGEDWETWKSFLQVLLETGRGGLVYFGADEDHLEAWPGFQGFPVSLSWREGGKVVYRFQVVTLENKTLDAKLFAPPAEYKPQSMLDLLKGQ